MPEQQLDNFSQWSRYILRELERLNERIEKIEKGLVETDKRLIRLERLAWLAVGLVALMLPLVTWLLIKIVEGMLF